MKNKIIYTSLGGIILIVIISIIALLIYNDTNFKIYTNVNNSQIINDNALTMMYETEAGSGEYQVSSDTTWPHDEYTFNETLSRCENGGVLTWDDENKKVLLQTNSSDKCYVYFDAIFSATLNNYTLSWNPINGAENYNIYSNGTLLTSTTETSVDLYEYYTIPGTYTITVSYVKSGNESERSNDISYSIEQLNDGKYLLLAGDLFAIYGKLDNYGSSVSFSINELYLFNTTNAFGYNSGEFWICDSITENGDQDVCELATEEFKLDQRIENIKICINTEAGSENTTYPFNLTYNYEFTESDCWEGPLEEANFGNGYLSVVHAGNNTKDITFVGLQNGGGQGFYITFSAPGYIDSNPLYGGIRVYCVSKNTFVYIYDEKKKKKRKKKIQDVTYDDLLLVWDFDNGKFAYAKPLWIKAKEEANTYNLLRFSDGSTLKTINQHRIFNVEKGMFTYPMSNDTPIGTTTLNSKGKLVKLISKEVINKKVEYYNIITDYHINLFTNDILTSCRFSNLYKIENLKYIKNNVINNDTNLFSNIDEKWINGLRLKEQPLDINRDNADYRGNIGDYIKSLEEKDIRK